MISGFRPDLATLFLLPALYFGSRSHLRTRGRDRRVAVSNISLSDVSGRPLASLFDGLRPNTRWSKGRYPPPARQAGCGKSQGAISRVLDFTGVEVSAHAQGNSCQSHGGFCYSCDPADDQVQLDYGYCSGLCGSGTSGYTVVTSLPYSGNGYRFIGTLSCNGGSVCNCNLSYCSDCGGGHGD